MKQKHSLPRFEIDKSVSRSIYGKFVYHYFARYLAKNGKEIWRTSEVYASKRAARNAVQILNMDVLVIETWK